MGQNSNHDQIYLIWYNLAYILYIQVDIEFKDFLAQEHNQKKNVCLIFML